MCRQFRIDRIWLTVSEPAELYADKGTEVYKYAGPMDLASIRTPACWFDDGLLFRDHWRFFCDRNEDNGPHYTNVLELQGPPLKEFKSTAYVPPRYR